MNILGKPICIISFLKNDCKRYSTKEENKERRKKQLKNWLYRSREHFVRTTRSALGRFNELTIIND